MKTSGSAFITKNRLFYRNSGLAKWKMKLSDWASDLDVKNVRVCPNQTIPGGVAAHQRGVETQKYHSCM